MIGYRPGDSPLHRAHPYTPLALAAALLLTVFAFGSPGAVGAAVLAAVVLAAAGGVLGYTARPALVLGLATWVLLLVLHGLFGPEPFFAVGPLAVSAPGLRRALVLGGRLTAILVAFLTVLAVVSPARLVDAMTDRGVPFARMYLLVSTLTLVPRLRARAAQILEAQQCRGLRLGGSPLARVAALGPLVLPLVLGALAEVDEQVLALDARGAGRPGRRTALAPPGDSAPQRTVRWAALLVAVAAFAAKFAGHPL
jgi:energy-coupling factor transport system permease protein